VPKLQINTWIEDTITEKNNIPKVCPKCNGKLSKTDASRECSIIFVWCKNLSCRWCEIYTT
jgi:hypothetical protein